MATREQLAARLGIPASQVTPRGLVDHAFPGVADCLPAGVVRDRFVERVGGELLEGGLADGDAPGDDVGYNNAVARGRQVLDMPEVRSALDRCRQGQGGRPGQPAQGGPGAALAVALAVALAAALGWWLYSRRQAAAPAPDRADRRVTRARP